MADVIESLNDALSDRYTIERELGRGGMATVYLARDLRHDRLVALKVLSPELAVAVGRQRFLREIALTAQLDHPHIVPLLDSGEANGVLFFVMPYVEGESLRDRLKREKQLPVDVALQITAEVSDALNFAHRRGIVHRDIKPENILLAAGHVRVADFGIARAVSTAAGDAITQTGTAIGTPVYMSPEQFDGSADSDARTDVYSLACVAYEMLAGQPPFTGGTAAAIFARKSFDALPSLRVVRDTVPVHVESAIAKALARVPADRFDSVAHFASALRQGTETAAPARATTRNPRSWRPVGAVVLALITLAAAAWGWQQFGPRSAVIDEVGVLPFENLARNPEQQQFFVDGMHVGLIDELNKIESLRVPSRTTTVAYSRGAKSLGEIASALDVDALVTGEVFRLGDSVRIEVRLIRPSTERPIWSGTYPGNLGDAATLPTRIAEDIVGRIEVRLTPTERQRLARRERVDPVALELFLQGQEQLRLNRLVAARQFFQRALERDSAYAPAYAAVAHTYNVSGFYGNTVPADVYPKARDAAIKALRFDETLADAHVQLAWTQAVYDWDWRQAEQGFRRALSLNQQSVLAHSLYSYFLHWHRRDAEAIAENTRAIDLDPAALIRRASGAALLVRIRRCDLAMSELAVARELENETQVDRPGYYSPDFIEALCQLQAGLPLEAISLMQRGLQSSTPDMRPRYQSDLAHALAVAGRTAEARALLRELLAVREREYVAPYLVAMVYLGLGEKDSVFHWLDRSHEVRDNWLAFVKAEPRWDPVRADPRFQDLLRAINLSP